MIVGVYPALLASDAAERDHPTVAASDSLRVILPDYLVENDLPSAYQLATGLSTTSGTARPRATSLPPSIGRAVNLPVKELRTSDAHKTHGTVRLMTDAEFDDDAFAVRVPTPGLKNAGFNAGGWLVVRPVLPSDLGPESWLIVLRARGRFGATNSEWTIAHAKELPGDEGALPRLQVSYGSATGKEFRPERLDRGELTLAATIVCHAVEAH
jgi:hypothetical protein